METRNPISVDTSKVSAVLGMIRHVTGQNLQVFIRTCAHFLLESIAKDLKKQIPTRQKIRSDVESWKKKGRLRIHAGAKKFAMKKISDLPEGKLLDKDDSGNDVLYYKTSKGKIRKKKDKRGGNKAKKLTFNELAYEAEMGLRVKGRMSVYYPVFLASKIIGDVSEKSENIIRPKIESTDGFKLTSAEQKKSSRWLISLSQNGFNFTGIIGLTESQFSKTTGWDAQRNIDAVTKGTERYFLDRLTRYQDRIGRAISK